MNLLKSVMLMTEYAECQKCGSASVGNGEGTLEVDDGVFRRTCKCGWEVEVKEAERNLESHGS